MGVAVLEGGSTDPIGEPAVGGGNGGEAPGGKKGGPGNGGRIPGGKGGAPGGIIPGGGKPGGIGNPGGGGLQIINHRHALVQCTVLIGG